MTTMAKVDEILARFDRKSPQDAYKQACGELGVHYQKEIYNLLPDVPSAYHRIQTLELDNCLLGPKGCMALLPIITVSTTLRKISVRTCGVSDEFVKELCEILQGHPSVRAVDVSQNPLVTVHSASHIINLMKNNSNMVNFDVDDTHVGQNVGNIIAALGQMNTYNVSTYYQDNYFKMKDLFGYLDDEGYGWVLLKSLVLNCPYPVLQEQFVERIASRKPRKRSDNKIAVNSFMELIYMNYKTEKEIGEFVDEKIDEPYVFMIANWKQLISATERYNESAESKVELPEDLHRIRIRDYLLVNEDADAIISTAAKLQEEETGAADVLKVSALNLLKSTKTAFNPPPSSKPIYMFFQDRDAAYIPDCLRNGSRLFSMGGMSMLNATAGTYSNIADVDPGDAPHTFSLPPTIVKMVVEFFNREYGKIPRKKESVIPDSPKTKKDKAMEKSAIPIRTFLDAEFVTDIERLKPCLLADYYARFALPIDDCTITLQEMVNVLDELYVQVRVDNLIPYEKIVEMENPLKVALYADFLSKHLLERDEDVKIIEPLQNNMAY